MDIGAFDRAEPPGLALPADPSHMENEMALVLSGERPVAAATSPSLLTRLARVLKNWRAARAQRLALNSLLELDAFRLDDLGINRGDLFDAIASKRRTAHLNDIRARNRRA